MANLFDQISVQILQNTYEGKIALKDIAQKIVFHLRYLLTGRKCFSDTCGSFLH